MSPLTTLIDAGIQASIQPNGGLKLSGLSKLTTQRKNQIIKYARTHKLAILAAISQSAIPAQCESCPAAGYWDFSQYSGQGLMCFHYAYFLGKPGKPEPCSEMRINCPREE